tara:strand:+ start:107 stop:322 length:216 start_codon:yes stop_codon:yes gene_type:complete
MHRLPRVPAKEKLNAREAQGDAPKRRTRGRGLQSEKANDAVNAIAIGTSRTTRTPESSGRGLAEKMSPRSS